METRTIHVPSDACFLVVYPDMQAQINVPQGLENQEIPLHSKYVVALTHLIADGDPMLDSLVREKWNELVEVFQAHREMEKEAAQ